MLAVCAKHGLSDVESAIVVENYLEAEITKKTTHGVTKFCFESQFFEDRKDSPQVVTDTGPVVKLNGNQEIGQIAAKMCIELCSVRAKKYGIAIVVINNIQRYGILRTWIRSFDQNNLFGIVMNTCEPAMTGFGGKNKALGTNPLAYSIRTKSTSYIVDMATSKVAMSNIWQAKRHGEKLPNNTFLDKEGNTTTNPNQAKSVVPFGEVKGYSLALLVQLLTGSVFDYKMGQGIKDMYDIGYFFLAIDPEKVGSIENMLEMNQKLIDELSSTGAIIPGSRSEAHGNSKIMMIEEDLINELEKLGK